MADVAAAAAAAPAGEAQHAPRLAIVPGKEQQWKGNFFAPPEATDKYVPVLVEVTPPPGSAYMPVDMCVVIDISGSMSADATIQNASGQSESHGLTLLDIAKHGVRTIASALGPQDRLSIVWFNHMAGQAMPLTYMDEGGCKRAGEHLDDIEAGGGTNIWLGLEQGLNALKQGVEPGRMSHVLLLTDGQTTNRGTVMTNLQAYKEQHEQLPGTVSTFGFGYNIDSPLLIDISDFGDATYSFIPDSGFVGTVFVNTLSNLLVTFSKEVFMNIEATDCEIMGVHGHYEMQKTDEGYRVQVGTMQYEQPRSIIVAVKLTGGGDPQIGGNVSYQFEGKEMLNSEFVEVSLSAADAPKVEPQWLRCLFIEAINGVTKEMGTVTEESLQRAQAILKGYVERLDGTEVTGNDFVKSLREDATGQSSEAVSRADWYRKWGGHYMPSLTFAHKTQQCNNFKDPGVQLYGGRLYAQCRDEADKKFNTLPAPKPSARSTRSHMGMAAPAPAAPTNMSSFNDRGGG